jgi:hypothetical protein
MSGYIASRTFWYAANKAAGPITFILAQNCNTCSEHQNKPDKVSNHGFSGNNHGAEFILIMQSVLWVQIG